MKKRYQRKVVRKCNHKFEIVPGQDLLVRVPLPMAEMWAEMQAQVEELNRASRIADPTSHSGKRSDSPRVAAITKTRTSSCPAGGGYVIDCKVSLFWRPAGSFDN